MTEKQKADERRGVLDAGALVGGSLDIANVSFSSINLPYYKSRIKIAPDFIVSTVKPRPNLFVRAMVKLFFDWEWVDIDEKIGGETVKDGVR